MFFPKDQIGGHPTTCALLQSFVFISPNEEYKNVISEEGNVSLVTSLFCIKNYIKLNHKAKACLMKGRATKLDVSINIIVHAIKPRLKV